MITDELFTLDPCYPPICVSLHELRHKRIVKSLALRKAQDDVRNLLDEVEYLDYRIENARECFMEEMSNDQCRFDVNADYYHQ